MLVYQLNCLIFFNIISRNQELTKANEAKRKVVILKNKQGLRNKPTNQNMLQVIHPYEMNDNK
jgi:gentisate 1,2-dioxygenase